MQAGDASGRAEPRQGAAAHDGLLDRPLSPRSLVASVLLGMDPPRMAAADLVRWCELFGVAEGTTRVALSRMVDRGELRTADARYELAGPLDARRSDQNEALARPDPHWDGRWELFFVHDGARTAAQRSELRSAMARRHCVELRDGAWTRPANLPSPVESVIASQCERWQGVPDTPLDLEALFSLDAWAARATELVSELERGRAAMPKPEALPRAFYAGAATIDHVRRDPRLPDALLTPRWPGDDLRDTYRSFQVEFGRAVATWLRTGRAQITVDGEGR